MGISLDSLETITKYIFYVHSYIIHSLLLFEPTTIHAGSVKAIHIEYKGKNDEEYNPNKSSFKPHNGNFKGKGKGKEKKAATTKEEGVNPSCTHCKKEVHDDEQCWKLHIKLKPKRFGGKGKKKMVATTQKVFGSKLLAP